ncbi:Ig-like domain-containing protein [Mucilaginibacter sp. BJC16-A38]|uniref:Ig-like domain-containing protein n=1 Tax=Mucilaginibacter phenanthrenivorans TaxID=1234842 RepID=UPI002157B46A|nr:Ig-like domain-containing protein [Mucilaginibacter phenanthrenivorans]MCR8560966.1 Ig-like domain-containing protein [Mucilaginibacter phenanthrenivorans]
MLNKKASFFGSILTAFCIILLISGCANRQNPQGGPRDHDPPKLLKATPENMTRNFKAKTIQLDFDEYFKLNNTYTEISMSPTPAKLPEYKIKSKSVLITLKDSLEKNTTYVINFGKAIADVNESNVLKNFTYVFSTGPHIDSLSVSGTVINSTTQQKEKDVTVMLFTLKQDSTLFGKKKPTVYATTDSSGNFSLNNLHPDDYRIYALKETTPDKIYNKDDELIAFNKEVIHLTKDTSNIQLKLFKQEPAKLRIINSFDTDGKLTFILNKRLDDPSIKIVYPPDFDKYKIVDFSKTKDTAMLYMRNMAFDSLRIAFYDKNKPLDTIAKRKRLKETFQRNMAFSFNITGDGKLKPGTDLIIRNNYPVDVFDAGQITLKEDSAEVTNFTVEKDTANPKNFFVKYRWKQNDNYIVDIGENAFTDIYGDKNKRFFKKFNIDKPENYSLLTLAITLPDTGKSYVVELLNENKDLLRRDVIHKSGNLVYKNYLTGKYGVRVVYDANKNGKWDSGNVKQKTQPENIWVDDTLITLRANWEQVTPITVPKEPTP